jgi:hypothetical protein
MTTTFKKNKILEKIDRRKNKLLHFKPCVARWNFCRSDFVSTLQAHFFSMHAGKTFQNIFKNCKFDFSSLPNFGIFI